MTSVGLVLILLGIGACIALGGILRHPARQATNTLPERGTNHQCEQRAYPGRCDAPALWVAVPVDAEPRIVCWNCLNVGARLGWWVSFSHIESETGDVAVWEHEVKAGEGWSA